MQNKKWYDAQQTKINLSSTGNVLYAFVRRLWRWWFLKLRGIDFPRVSPVRCASADILPTHSNMLNETYSIFIYDDEIKDIRPDMVSYTITTPHHHYNYRNVEGVVRIWVCCVYTIKRVSLLFLTSHPLLFSMYCTYTLRVLKNFHILCSIITICTYI